MSPTGEDPLGTFRALAYPQGSSWLSQLILGSWVLDTEEATLQHCVLQLTFSKQPPCLHDLPSKQGSSHLPYVSTLAGLPLRSKAGVFGGPQYMEPGTQCGSPSGEQPLKMNIS